MVVLRWFCASALVAFVIGLSFGMSFGEEESALDFLLEDYLTGRNFTFLDIMTARANVMLVTATDCHSCIKELQALDWIRAKYRGDVSVNAVFVDRAGRPRVQRYADYYKFDIDKILIDDGQTVPARFKASFIPTLFIFDGNGVQTFRKEGFKDGDESTLIARIDETLVTFKTMPERKAVVATAAGSPQVAASAPKPPAKPALKTTGCASTGT